jgi:hypothetical protein
MLEHGFGFDLIVWVVLKAKGCCHLQNRFLAYVARTPITHRCPQTTCWRAAPMACAAAAFAAAAARRTPAARVPLQMAVIIKVNVATAVG